MSNITSLVGAQWYFGLSFNTSAVANPSFNIPLVIQSAQQILGSHLSGLSIGNEPDLYVDHSNRPSGWGVTNFVNEFNSVVSAVSSSLVGSQAAFVGPSICCQEPGFELPDIINAGWLTANQNHLAAITVQHYPTNNCGINGKVIAAQDIFPNFLNHTSAQGLVQLYANDSAAAQAAGKPFVMLETNTASCGGFPGLSDSFGAAMWCVQVVYGRGWS